jgi:transcriptional regulator with XRE-family HTH domain
MLFSALYSRFVATLQERVRNGELTERGLARRTGVSQPHIHHVLKGARTLSLRSADQILTELGIDLIDLLQPEELEARLGFRQVPVLTGLLGPGYAFTEIPSRTERYPFPASELEGVEGAVVTRLAPDPQMYGLFGQGSRALLDRSESQRRNPIAGMVYHVVLDGQDLLRYVRNAGSRLMLIPHDTRHDPSAWHSISLTDRNILDVVKAKLIWIGRRLEPLPIAEPPTEETS